MAQPLHLHPSPPGPPPHPSLPPPSLIVHDLDASRAFYQAAFAASVTWDARTAAVLLPGGAKLMLVGSGPPPGRSFDAGAWEQPAPAVPQHVCLPMTVRSFEAWQRTLFLSGVAIEKWCGANGVAATVCVRDLDGHLLELEVRETATAGTGTGPVPAPDDARTEAEQNTF